MLLIGSCHGCFVCIQGLWLGWFYPTCFHAAIMKMNCWERSHFVLIRSFKMVQDHPNTGVLLLDCLITPYPHVNVWYWHCYCSSKRHATVFYIVQYSQEMIWWQSQNQVPMWDHFTVYSSHKAHMILEYCNPGWSLKRKLRTAVYTRVIA